MLSNSLLLLSLLFTLSLHFHSLSALFPFPSCVQPSFLSPSLPFPSLNYHCTVFSFFLFPFLLLYFFSSSSSLFYPSTSSSRSTNDNLRRLRLAGLLSRSRRRSCLAPRLILGLRWERVREADKKIWNGKLMKYIFGGRLEEAWGDWART